MFFKKLLGENIKAIYLYLYMYIFISWNKTELFNQDVHSTDYFFKDLRPY